MRSTDYKEIRAELKQVSGSDVGTLCVALLAAYRFSMGTEEGPVKMVIQTARAGTCNCPSCGAARMLDKLGMLE